MHVLKGAGRQRDFRAMAEKLARAEETVPSPSVLFLHPDLGVGGAERLVLDAALALQARGCSVKIWTAHYDPSHSFAESRELPVRCAGDWLPRSLGWGGRGAAVCAYVRMIFLALYVLFLGDEEFDVVVCDQVRRLLRALAPPPFLTVEGILLDLGCPLPACGLERLELIWRHQSWE